MIKFFWQVVATVLCRCASSFILRLHILLLMKLHTNMKYLQLNTEGQYAGNDLRVEQAWLQGITGCNVTVTVVDDGKTVTL